MTLTPPLFCSMCAAPCLLPRINPDHLSSPSTSASCSSSDYSPNSNSNSPAGSSESSLNLAKLDWLSEWYCLRVSSGIIDPTPFFFHHFGEPALPPPFHSELDSKFQSSSNSSSGSNSASAGLGGSGKSAQTHTHTHTQTPETPPPRDGRRCITIHAYCLSAVRSMIRQSASSASSTTAGSNSDGNGVGRAGARTHEEGVMLSWSLPRWTGHGPWMHRDMRDPKAWTWPDRSRSDTTRRGDGGGSSEADQRGDGWSMSIGYWGGTAAQRERWQRTGDHLEATCSSFYHGLALDLPSWIWDLLTLDSVRRYRCDLLKRWRANPSGVGSASCLWSAFG
ncbi:hypothetical protein I316_07701 [Kwoniella heveanensis BCC8398]|uniref:Uncharacterized protein n=1 Tax=Kwoniella heveanensis BCC8398 TaxID=1296120 RepID=A0A1B9GI48_9TREE|nr:hypothetical protein I316_07701 [Kwoniella heveanensis BCC8398]